MSDVLTLPARLDLPGASEVLNELKKFSGPVHVDASALTHLGALGLQVLVAAARDAKARDAEFQFTGSSERILAQMAVMGVSPEQLMEGAL